MTSKTICFFKKGSGAAWTGVSFIILTFFLMIFLMNYFNWFDGMIQTQTKTDALADAMAVQVNDGTGIPNIREMERTKVEMINLLNSTSTTKIQPETVQYDPDLIFGDNVNSTDKLLELSLITKTPFLNASFYKRSSIDDAMNFFGYKGENTTKILSEEEGTNEVRFPNDITKDANPEFVFDRIDGFQHTKEVGDGIYERYVDPADTSYPYEWHVLNSGEPKHEMGNQRGYIDPEKYRQIVLQFQVDRTERYQSQGDDTRQNIYIWDVTKALGCELPYYYVLGLNLSAPSDYDSHPMAYDKNNNAVTGKPWRQNEEGRPTSYHNEDADNDPDNGFQLSSYVEATLKDNANNKLINFAYNHIPDLRNKAISEYGNNQHWRNPYPMDTYFDYNNWYSLINGSMHQIQWLANNGYPVVLAFENGDAWIVVPEIAESRQERGLYVSFASSFPESAQAAMAGNTYANNCLVGYRQPTGNYVALVFGRYKENSLGNSNPVNSSADLDDYPNGSPWE